jgi:hypothetical protein
VPVNQPSGPPKAVRPFQPRFAETDPVERIAHALEHIATALTAIDHNVQLLVTTPRHVP